MIDFKREKKVRFLGKGPSTSKVPFLAPLSKLGASPRDTPRITPHGTPRGKGLTPENTPRGKSITPRGTPRSRLFPKDKEELVTEDLREKLRPVLEHRMPTLANRAAFGMAGDGGEQSAAPGRHPEGLRQLQQAAPPRTMRDVRAAVTKELKSVTRKVARLEREYYGERKTVHDELEKYVYPVKMLMKALWLLDLNKFSSVEDMIKQTTNPDRYKEDPKKQPAALKEVFAKLQTFLPDRMVALVESCQGLLDNVVRYCVSFYDADTDSYLETPAHYTEQIAAWKQKAELSIQSARNLYTKFKTTGITASMLSSPVAALCSRYDMNKLLFLVMFTDACTHIRGALSVLNTWLQTDENYASYVKNDLTELEKLKEEKMKDLREVRQKCHTLTFSVTKLEGDHAKLSRELRNMREKEESLRIDEVSLVNELSDMELEMEFKERRRENIKRRPVSEHGEPSAETYETLTSELKSLKERYPAVVRSLGQVRLKLSQVDSKLGALHKVHRDILSTLQELSETEEDRNVKEQEFGEIEEACQLARKVLLCKTSNDATEKLYYSVPFGNKVAKGKNDVIDPVSRVCKVISTRIERDWVALYQNLNFYPQRGAETIEHDLAELMEQGARVSLAKASRQALDRWKRHHTRANVEDLRQALKKIKRFDILKVVDRGLQAPPKTVDPFEPQEELPPPVEPKLVPYYRLIEKYDQIRASKTKSCDP